MTSAALPQVLPLPDPQAPLEADLERRFGGLRRLYGDAGYQRVRGACVAVLGLGGVGSWAAEALARSGVASLVLVDLDHVAESNINRQVQALGSTVGMGKAEALARRIADIHPGCLVHVVEEFAVAANWPGLLPVPVQAAVDACDQSHAKLALAQWSLITHTPLVVCGAAGGKQQAQRVEVADLSEATHDPLLASLRQRLRKQGAARTGRIGLRCVFSREPVAMPDAVCGSGGTSEDISEDISKGTSDGSLNCHGYGSTVTVTATFGMVAAGVVLEGLVKTSA